MAVRRHPGNLGSQYAEAQRVDDELDELSQNLDHGDPSVDGKAGNLNARNVEVTTLAVDVEVAIAHGLSRIPSGFEPVCPTKSGYRYLASLYPTKDADADFVYLAAGAAIDANKKGVVRIG